MGLLKALAVAWVFGWEDTVKRVGFASAAIFTYGYAAAVFTGIILSSALWDVMDNTLYLAVAIPAGVFVFVLAIVLAFVARSNLDEGFLKWGSQVIFAGPEILRHTVSGPIIDPIN